MSITIIKYFPHLGTKWNKTGTGFSWTGVCTHKNTLGVALSWCILFFIWKWVILKDYKGIRLDIFLLSIASYIMFNPLVKGSSTSILSLFVGILFIYLIRRFINHINSFMFIVYAIFASYFLSDFVLTTFSNTSIIEVVALQSGRDLTFTGRTDIWKGVLSEASDHPIAGTGYGAFWTGNRLARLYTMPGIYGVKQAHNGYIETYANLGILGLIILILLCYTSLRSRVNNLKNNYYFNSISVAVIIITIVSEFFEGMILAPNSLKWLTFLIFTTVVNKPHNQ
jgi:O-antigen ligase